MSERGSWHVSGPRALARLARLSLAPTPLADIAAGVLIGAQGHWPPGLLPFGVALGSSSVYHGALALNDYADRELDARERPGRPLPAGEVGLSAAIAVGALLAIGAPVLLTFVDLRLGALLGLISGLALLYDFVGRGCGPSLLAACRGGNLALGLLAGWIASGGGALLESTVIDSLWVALAYGLYVFVVSRLGRMEDGAAPIGERPRALLRVAGLLLALGPAFTAPLGAPLPARALALGLGVAGAFGLFRAASQTNAFTRGDVERCMGLALRRLLVFTAAAAAVTWRTERLDALVVAALILAGYPLSHALRRAFPPS